MDSETDPTFGLTADEIEIERLKEINAELLAACEAAMQHFWGCNSSQYETLKMMRDAITKTREKTS